MNRYYDPIAMLTGRVGQVAPGMMVPAGGGGVYIPPAAVWPGPDYGPNCRPSACPPMGYCPPQSPGFYAQAAAAAEAAKAPQSSLAFNSIEQTPNTPIAAMVGVVPGTRVLSASPTVPICITQLKFSITDEFFLVGSIRAARKEYGADGQSFPASNYRADSTTPPLQMPMLMPGTPITVQLFNIDAAAHHAFGEFRGFPGPGCDPCL